MAYPLVIGRADESHLLHGARRVLDGQVIYRDFFEIIPPLAFYVVAAVYWLAGTTLVAARTAMALIEATGAAALFALVVQVAGTWEAVLATLGFVVLCIPVWPYASAHWMTTALALVAAAVLPADRRRESRRLRPLAAGLLTGAAICVQQQRGVFLLAWLLLALPVLAVPLSHAGSRARLRTEAAWGVGGAAAVTLVVLGHAAWAASLDAVVDHLYRFARDSYGPQHAGSTAWAGVVPLTNVYLLFTWRWVLRVAPLVLVAEGIVLAAKLRALRSGDRRLVVRACCWLLGLFMTLSVWYLPDFIHVSFVAPFLFIVAAPLVHAARSSPAWARIPGGRCVVTAGLLGVAVALCVKGVTNVMHARAGATVHMETGFGRLAGDEFVVRLLDAIRP